MDKMLKASPHFVRCIKPNNDKLPGQYTAENVKRQLLYAGVVETTRIRRDGYAIRMGAEGQLLLTRENHWWWYSTPPQYGEGRSNPASDFSRSRSFYFVEFMLTCAIPMTRNHEGFEEFIHTYKAVGLQSFEVPNFDNEDEPPSSGTLRAACKKICKACGIRGAQFGITKVFLKYYHGEALMQKMESASNAATLLAAHCRGLLARKLLVRMRLAKEKKVAEEKARREQERKLAEMKRQQEEAAARAAELAAKLELQKFETIKREQATLKKRKLVERQAAIDALHEAEKQAEAARVEQERIAKEQATELARQKEEQRLQIEAEELAEAERLDRREREDSAKREKSEAARLEHRASEVDMMATPTKIDYNGVTAADMQDKGFDAIFEVRVVCIYARVFSLRVPACVCVCLRVPACACVCLRVKCRPLI